MNEETNDQAAGDGMCLFRNWLVNRAERENSLGKSYEAYREFDNGLQCTVHYQKAAILQRVLTNFDAAIAGTFVADD